MASKHDVLNLYYKRILFDCSSGPNKKIRISHIFEIRQKTGIGGISWFQPYLNKLFFLYVRSSASAVIRKNIGKKTKQGKLILNLKKDYVWNSNGNAYLLLQLEDWCTHFFFFSLLFRLQSYKSFYTELHWMVPHRKTKIHHRQFLKCKNQTLMMLLEPMQFLIST